LTRARQTGEAAPRRAGGVPARIPLVESRNATARAIPPARSPLTSIGAAAASQHAPLVWHARTTARACVALAVRNPGDRFSP
jgi:hypothetical protein